MRVRRYVRGTARSLLNVGFGRRALKLGNEFIEFKARFGVSRDIPCVPVSH